MAYQLPSNLIFLHCPKTGGTSLLKAFERCGIRLNKICHEHATYDLAIEFSTVWTGLSPLSFYRNSIKNYHSGYSRCKTFGVVRHPYSYYPSLYYYLLKRKKEGVTQWRNVLGKPRWHPWEFFDHFHPAAMRSFDEFMIVLMHKRPGYLTHLYESYFPAEKISYVLQLENLEEDLRKVDELNGIGFDFSIKTENANNYPIAWRRDILDEMYTLERAALDRLNYSPIYAD